MATKHEQILQYILSIDIGYKISVRQIAKTLNVSDGTAYRAIKEAENQGLVNTIERVGTVRIEQKKNNRFENLTFAEVIKIVDGQVLGGNQGLHKTLNKFVIGAMQLDPMQRYTHAGSLLIVGNRQEAHEMALNQEAAVLITGGFDTNTHIKKLADDKDLPIMSTSYDTFTVAAMINRAIYDQLIKKEIVFVEDIYTPLNQSLLLYTTDTLERWYTLNEQSAHTRYPVLDNRARLAGILTPRDIIGQGKDVSVQRLMSKSPITVQEKTSLAYVAHMMVWEGIEVIPVVDENNSLKGLVSRQDVLEALQQIQRQPQVGETIEDMVAQHLKTSPHDETVFEAKVTPQMTNQLGTLSNGICTSLMAESCSRLLRYYRKGDLVVENMTIYFLKPVSVDSYMLIQPQIIETGRIYAKLDVEIYSSSKIVGKGLLMAKIIDR